MILDVLGALHAAIVADAPTVALLATYEDEPAVFSGEAVPGDAEPPFVIYNGSLGETPNDTKTCEARDIVVQVETFAEKTGSAVEVELLARTLLEALHRKVFPITGGTMLVSDVSGPAVLESGAELVARVLTVRMLVRE